jgi:uncharacterized protein
MKVRVILDTNLWISYLISKRLNKIDVLFEENAVVLIFSEELLTEFIEVAQRPKFRKYFSEESLKKLLELFDVYGEIVQVSSVVEVCRDIKDNFLLALAKDSQADYLVTGDADLLIIKKFEHTEIVTYTEFEVRLDN